jgi:uncharacterized membrane protein
MYTYLEVTTMTTTKTETWTAEHTIETAAPPETLWAIFRDVPGWKTWNAGIERIELEGPFAPGTWFTMKPPGQDAMRSQLVDVRENERFVDETRVGDLVVTVAHRLERLPGGRTRVTYVLDAAGPGAQEIGPMIAADFPEVLAALAALAQGKSAA